MHVRGIWGSQIVSASSQLHEAQRLRSAHTHAKSHSHWDGWTFSDPQKTWRFFDRKKGGLGPARQLLENITGDPALSHPTSWGPAKKFVGCAVGKLRSSATAVQSAPVRPADKELGSVLG